MVAVPDAEHAGRLRHFEDVAGSDAVVEPVGDHAVGDALDGDGEIRVRLRRARHRIAAEYVVAADAGSERAELTGPIPKRVAEVRGDIEHERARVVRLVDHRLHRDAMEAVIPSDVWFVDQGDAPG